MRLNASIELPHKSMVGVVASSSAPIVKLEIYTKDSMRCATLNTAQCDELILILKKARHLADSHRKNYEN
jgi:hypothetical protein